MGLIEIERSCNVKKILQCKKAPDAESGAETKID